MRTLTAGQQRKYHISHRQLTSNPIDVLPGNRRHVYASPVCEDPCETESRRIAKFVTAQSESCRHPFGFVLRSPAALKERPTGHPARAPNWLLPKITWGGRRRPHATPMSPPSAVPRFSFPGVTALWRSRLSFRGMSRLQNRPICARECTIPSPTQTAIPKNPPTCYPAMPISVFIRGQLASFRRMPRFQNRPTQPATSPSVFIRGELASSENNVGRTPPSACDPQVASFRSTSIFIPWGDRAMAVKAFVPQNAAIPKLGRRANQATAPSKFKYLLNSTSSLRPGDSQGE